jgi:hypothetical protein
MLHSLEGENFVKDSEVRGIVLKELYEIRHTNPHAAIPADVPGLLEIDPNVLLGVLRQLRDKGLIEFTALSGGHNMFGRGKISAFGVDVVEDVSSSPIAISIDNSVSVHGSQGIQIGGQGNSQTVTLDIGKLINAIDGGTGTIQEKEEAKSLLKKLAENPLVKTAVEWWAKSHLGT